MSVGPAHDLDFHQSEAGYTQRWRTCVPWWLMLQIGSIMCQA